MLKLAVDCTGIRATERILGISKDTVRPLKNNRTIDMEYKLWLYERRKDIEFEIVCATEAEMDEMWSFI